MLGGYPSRKTTLLPNSSHTVLYRLEERLWGSNKRNDEFRNFTRRREFNDHEKYTKVVQITSSGQISRKRVITFTYKPLTDHSRATFKYQSKCTNFVNFKYTGRSRNLSSKICTEFWRLSIIQNGPWYCYT